MAESTLTQFYQTVQDDLALMLGYGASFYEGNIDIATATVTFNSTDDPVPDTADIMRLWTSGTTHTAVSTRDSDTQVTLASSPGNLTASAYILHPWDNAQWNDLKRCIRDGYHEFLHPIDPDNGRLYQWKFLRLIQSVTVWPDQNTNTSNTVVYGTYDSTNNQTDVTVSGGTFYETMVGKTFQAYDNAATPATTNTYPVKSYTSSTVIEVEGDASSETDATVYSIAANGDYRMPDAFGGIDGKMYYDDTNTLRPELTPANPMQIIGMRQGISVATGTPHHFAVKPLDTFAGATGQRYELMVYPEPDQVYTLKFTGQLHPSNMTETLKYALGGMPHGHTLKQAALWCGAKTFNKPNDETYERDYRAALAASISYDKKAFGAESAGYNLNRPGSIYINRHAENQFVTYNGTQYGP